MVLVDSSVWIHLQREHLTIDRYIPESEIAVCPSVVLEVLRGATTPRQYTVMRQLMLTGTMLDSPTPFARFEEAAQLYKTCRAHAVTVRSSIDCLVAATAIAHNVPILHNDRDFEHIARVVPLKLASRS